MSWEERTLDQCATFQSGGTPRKSRAEYWGGDMPWVSSGEMTESFISETSLNVTDLGAKSGTRRVPENTILVVVRGMSLAKEFRISITKREMTFNQDIKALKCVDDVDANFLFYALKAKKEQIRDRATDASHGTKKLDMAALKATRIPLPKSIETQKKIARVAANYDDLIENNRRRIALLEEAARLIYREWFVHFRFPNHENTEFENGLPVGWEMKKVADIGQIITGKTPSKKKAENFGGSVPFIKTPDMHGNVYVLNTTETLTELGMQTQPKKTLPPNSVVVSCIGTVGIVSLVAKQSQFNQQINAVICHDWISPFFAYFCLQGIKQSLEAIGGGVTMANVSKTKFQSVDIVLPSSKFIANFHDISLPIFEQIKTLALKNQALTKARDLLLPRLMDGRISV